MTERDEYQQAVRDLGAAYLAQRAKRPMRERIAALLGRQPTLPVVPPKRASGPRLVISDLPDPVFGPRCQECRLSVFAGEDTLHGRGLCGECAGHDQGSPAPVLHPYGEAGGEPPRAA